MSTSTFCKCVLLFVCVREFIAESIAELQIATAMAFALIGQLLPPKTYRRCYRR